MKEIKSKKLYVIEIDGYATSVYKTKKLAEKDAEIFRKNKVFETVVIGEIPYYYEAGKEEV